MFMVRLRVVSVVVGLFTLFHVIGADKYPRDSHPDCYTLIVSKLKTYIVPKSAFEASKTCLENGDETICYGNVLSATSILFSQDYAIHDIWYRTIGQSDANQANNKIKIDLLSREEKVKSISKEQVYAYLAQYTYKPRELNDHNTLTMHVKDVRPPYVAPRNAVLLCLLQGIINKECGTENDQKMSVLCIRATTNDEQRMYYISRVAFTKMNIQLTDQGAMIHDTSIGKIDDLPKPLHRPFEKQEEAIGELATYIAKTYFNTDRPLYIRAADKTSENADFVFVAPPSPRLMPQ